MVAVPHHRIINAFHQFAQLKWFEQELTGTQFKGFAPDRGILFPR